VNVMSRRTTTIFWTAVAVAVFLLGGGVATVLRVLDDGAAGDYPVLSLTVIGLASALLVAGRIAFVSARAQRRARRS
jgi:hypothetical protein